MTISKCPLSDSEKKLLRRTFRTRVVIGIIFLVPLLGGIGLFTYFTIIAPAIHQDDSVFLVPVLIVIIILLLCFTYVVPFYRSSYKNLFITDKMVVETRILNVSTKLRSKGFEYVIETDYRKISSWSVAILKLSIPFNEMTAGMAIKIHCLDNNKFDILDITR